MQRTNNFSKLKKIDKFLHSIVRLNTIFDRGLIDAVWYSKRHRSNRQGKVHLQVISTLLKLQIHLLCKNKNYWMPNKWLKDSC
jgi:hypothetical protein